MASLGADTFTQQQIRQSANRALKSADNSVSKEIKEELARVGGKVDDVGLTSKTLINKKIKILPTEKLCGNQADTFLNSKYIIAETTEDILTYRRFGGSAKLRGAYVSTYEKLTREELALVKEFNNSMRFEAIIKIPKGEKLAVGKVGP
ncbi:hypothetical protein [Capnocytophaga canimorsus]|uniref:hypothetical protein n=1 Tax=Capnocytophaga canimorsus TaxID=28188 RepID=UPI00385F723F